VRKSLGVAGLLALLVVPLTGPALANNDPHPPTHPPPANCVVVLVKANVGTNANVGVTGNILKANVAANALVSGDVFVRICIAADIGVNAALTGAAATAGNDGCVNVKATGNLAAGLTGGGVRVTAEVLAGVNQTNVATLNGSVTLAPMTTINGAVLADLKLCINANANVGVTV
jgi:hypothetical protein